MATPRIYTVQRGLAGPKAFTVVSALRGPDGRHVRRALLKCHTAAVIRFWVEGAAWWGAVAALPFVVCAANDSSHYGVHIHHAARAIGLPVLGISEELVETLTYPPTTLSDDIGWRLWTRGWIEACYLEVGKERPNANVS